MPTTSLTMRVRARRTWLIPLGRLVVNTLGWVALPRAVRLTNWLFGFVVFEYRTVAGRPSRRPWYRRVGHRTRWQRMDHRFPKLEVTTDAD